MIKQLIELVIETRSLCRDLAIILGMASKEGGSLSYVVPALKLYKKFAMLGLTEWDIEKISDKAIRRMYE